MATTTQTQTGIQGSTTVQGQEPIRVDTENTTIFPTFESIPEFDSIEKKRQWLLEEMAGAFRLFARKGYGIGSAGHISVRDPGNPNHFWLNPLGVHFGLLKASDMVLVDHEGNVIGGSFRAVNKAGFQIHSAVHHARPDVIAACHTHSVFGKAYSAFGKPLDMLNQDACTFYNNQAVYHDFGGVVLSKEEGTHIADALGPKKRCLFLQNHGLLTAGSTVGEAAFLFILMEQSCEAQLLSDASREKPRLISDEVAEFTYKATAYPAAVWAEFQTELQYEEHLDGSFRN